ncbi:carbohydrate ABC transporter permease [Flindersiella endophytica]
MTTRAVWEERPTAAGQTGKSFVLGAVVLAVLVPLWVVLLTSLSTEKTITSAGGLVLVPGEISFRAYEEILSGGVVTRALLVSLGITFVGTSLSVSLTALAAYGLSRPGSVGHRPILLIVLLTFLFAPGLIPTYLTVQSLGLLNTYWALILPGAVWAFNLVVLRSFFMGIPRELLESARIDGAGDFRILLTIVLPLSKAAVAVIALFYGVGYWNAWFNALLYLDDNTMYPLSLFMRNYVLQGEPIPGVEASETSSLGEGPVPSLAIKMAVVAIATIPVMFVYPFVQRHFTKGVIIGAIKG